MMEAAARAKAANRIEHRRTRKNQIRQGRRPRRERTPSDVITFGTANVTSAATWREEYDHGQTLRRIHYCMIQEHGTRRREDIDSLSKWLQADGAEPIIDPAYIKDTDEGGGTALVARSAGGIRRLREDELCDNDDSLEGRLSIGIGSAGFEFALAALYGITGGGRPVQANPPLARNGDKAS